MNQRPASALASEAPTGAGRFATVAGALVLTAAYGLVHALIRLGASSNLGEDDPVSALHTQVLALGYRPSQPPLYDWLLYGAQQLFGLGVLPHLVLKYVLLVVVGGCIFVSARQIMGSSLWALLTVELLALIYSLSWRMHEAFTFKMVEMAAAAALFAVMLAVLDGGGALVVLSLGLALGLGLLSGVVFAGMAASLLIAVLLQPTLRARLLDWRVAPAVVIAVAMVLPYLWWVAAEPGRIAEALVSFTGSHQPLVLANGLADAVLQPLAYLFPLIAIVPLLFSRWLGTAFARNREAAPPHRPELERLVRDQALVAVGLLAAATLIAGHDNYPVHAIAPLVINTPVWLMAVACRTPAAGRRLQIFTVLAGAIALIALVARLFNLYALDPYCKLCRWGIPYAGLAHAMRANGFSTGTIVAVDGDLAANLRRFFPDLVFKAEGHAPGLMPGRHQFDPTVYVWETTVPGKGQRVKFSGRQPRLPDAAEIARSVEVVVPWQHLWRAEGYRTSSFRIVFTHRPAD